MKRCLFLLFKGKHELSLNNKAHIVYLSPKIIVWIIVLHINITATRIWCNHVKNKGKYIQLSVLFKEMIIMEFKRNAHPSKLCYDKKIHRTLQFQNKFSLFCNIQSKIKSTLLNNVVIKLLFFMNVFNFISLSNWGYTVWKILQTLNNQFSSFHIFLFHWQITIISSINYLLLHLSLLA